MENITEKWLLFDTLSNLVMEVNPDYDRSDEIFRFGLRIILHFYSFTGAEPSDVGFFKLAQERGLMSRDRVLTGRAKQAAVIQNNERIRRFGNMVLLEMAETGTMSIERLIWIMIDVIEPVKQAYFATRYKDGERYIVGTRRFSEMFEMMVSVNIDGDNDD